METTARGDVPKTLHTIAYISIPNSADLEFLLWDLQDAIAAYARFSGTALPLIPAAWGGSGAPWKRRRRQRCRWHRAGH